MKLFKFLIDSLGVKSDCAFDKNTPVGDSNPSSTAK